VRAHNQTCPASNLRLPSVPVPLICQCCRAQYHKQIGCSGLTRGALDARGRSKHWECISCIDDQARDAVNEPEVNPVSSRGSSGGVRRGLQVLQWNVDGSGTAIADVIILVWEDPGLDVLLLQETKLIPANPTPTISGYFVIRRDQPPNPGGRGGGFLTYVMADISFCQIPAYREEEIAGGLEALAVEIQRGARGKFVVTNLYMPPIREGGQSGFNPGAIRVPAIQFLLGATSMHIPLSGLTPSPEMGLEPSWRSR
jgi:hypothetical protein